MIKTFNGELLTPQQFAEQVDLAEEIINEIIAEEHDIFVDNKPTEIKDVQSNRS